MCVIMYIYIYRERERHINMYIYIYIYRIYIYIYIYRERERDTSMSDRHIKLLQAAARRSGAAALADLPAEVRGPRRVILGV